MKCSKEKWCAAMAEALGDIGRRRGFNTVNLVNLKTGKMRFVGIRYCVNAKDRGVLLNFCPWCGAEINFFEEAKTAIDTPKSSVSNHHQPQGRKSKSSLAKPEQLDLNHKTEEL